MAFAQLTRRDRPRDIKSCLFSNREKLYHMGLRTLISQFTLDDAKERRNFWIYQDFGYSFVKTARDLYQDESLAIELDKSLYAFDSTAIDLCLSLFH